VDSSFGSPAAGAARHASGGHTRLHRCMLSLSQAASAFASSMPSSSVSSDRGSSTAPEGAPTGWPRAQRLGHVDSGGRCRKRAVGCSPAAPESLTTNQCDLLIGATAPSVRLLGPDGEPRPLPTTSRVAADSALKARLGWLSIEVLHIYVAVPDLAAAFELQ
jgi:hypothetical protein